MNHAVMSKEDFIKAILALKRGDENENVPRGTFLNEATDNLEKYLDLLKKWNRTYNLVGEKTLEDPWRRHILDAAQIFPMIPRPATDIVMDIGTGAGIPGLVLAIMGVDHMHLVESSQKKGEFLREATRQLGLQSKVVFHVERLENIPPYRADVITARAFAPLPDILQGAAAFYDDKTTHLYLKGESVDDECRSAEKIFEFQCDKIPSPSDPRGCILRLRDVRRKSTTAL